MRTEPKKNWRGFTPHMWRLLREVLDEFPEVKDRLLAWFYYMQTIA